MNCNYLYDLLELVRVFMTFNTLIQKHLLMLFLKPVRLPMNQVQRDALNVITQFSTEFSTNIGYAESNTNICSRLQFFSNNLTDIHATQK